MEDAVDEAWRLLYDALEARSRAMLEEVRRYPTPIARCDEQLTQAIEDRDAAFRLLKAATEIDALRCTSPRAAWRERAAGFVASLEADGDAAIGAARTRFAQALDTR